MEGRRSGAPHEHRLRRHCRLPAGHDNVEGGGGGVGGNEKAAGKRHDKVCGRPCPVPCSWLAAGRQPGQR